MPRDHIAFNGEYEPEVLSEDKFETLRFNWKEIPEVGSTVKAINASTNEKFATLEILDIEIITISECVERDFEGHRNYDSIEELIEELNRFYDHDFKPETELILITFKLV